MNAIDWEAKGKERLAEEFNKVCVSFPVFTKEAKPLGIGGFGIVIEHNDQTLTKILFKPGKEWGNYADKAFKNESDVMRLFTDNPLNGLNHPLLIDEPNVMENDEKYLGHYRMTHLEGHIISLHAPPNKVEPSILKRAHKSAGRMIAKFHREARKLPFEKLKQPPGHDGDEIKQISTLPAKTNEALAKANIYFQANKKEGIVHGDFHDGNILFDDDQEAVGLIDFSNTGRHKNIFVDLADMNEDYDEDFIQAYEDESGETIDRHMITATKLTLSTNYLYKLEISHGDGQEDMEKDLRKSIEKDLRNISTITGYHP